MLLHWDRSLRRETEKAGDVESDPSGKSKLFRMSLH